MLKVSEGKVPVKNATVTLGELEHDGFAERDPEGNVLITVDAEPEVGQALKIVLHKENDATYTGSVGEDGVFVP